MANNTANVSTGKPKTTGAIFVAPKGTELPTDASSELNVAFKCLGYISEDGLTNSMPRTNESVKDWGGNTVEDIQTEVEDKFKYKMLESLNEQVLKEVFGDSNVTVSGTKISIKKNAKELEEHAYIVEMILKGNKAKRIVIPSGKIVEIEDVTYVKNAATGYGVTISCHPDTDGNTHYEYIE